MMKATGLKRGSRKKDKRPEKPQVGGNSAAPTTAAPSKPPSQPPQPDPRTLRRQPSAEETALTTKNYRLAKELNENRIRYRDECKKTTRMTMENMNLASRCREAISHVSMLKKELARHQQRAAEALALQREQTQRMASNLSTEMSRLSQSQSTDSQDSDPAPTTVTPTSKKFKEPVSVRSKSKGTPDSPNTSGEHLLDFLDDIDGTDDDFKPQDASKPPKVYSTPNRNRNANRWTPHIDATPNRIESDGTTLFPHSASPKVVSVRQHREKNYNEEYPPDMLPQSSHRSPTSSVPNRLVDPDEDDDEDEGPISDFDAAFDNTFASSFPTGDSANKNSSPGEVYNPFFPSPARGDAESTPVSSPERVGRLFEDDGDDDDHSPAEEKKTPDRPEWGSQFQTPPKEPKEINSLYDHDYGEPSRPQKTVPASARARYEKALQPRSEVMDDVAAPKPREGSVADKASSILRGSPSALLKRIHQRRVNRQQSAPTDLGEEPMKPELGERNHSAPERGGETPFDETEEAPMTRSRRKVVQPISYAEPSLNTKLRKGDTFFPKPQEARVVVTPEHH